MPGRNALSIIDAAMRAGFHFFHITAAGISAACLSGVIIIKRSG